MMKYIYKYIVATAFILSVSGVSAYAQEYKDLVEKAMDYTRKDSLQQAEQLYQQALKLDPKNARNALLFSNLGTVQRRMGKIDDALQSYTLALNIIPYSTAILLNRATIYMEKGMLDKAYLDYCNVIDLLPEDKEARLFRAYIYMQRRQYKEARIDYNVIIGKDFGNKPARIGLAMLDQKEEKYVSAIDRINLLIHDYPEDASLLKMRANLELEQGQDEAALADLEAAVRREPSSADTYELMGDICLRLKKKAEARKYYEEAIQSGVSRASLSDKLKKCR